jgi:hypothetical protein
MAKQKRKNSAKRHPLVLYGLRVADASDYLGVPKHTLNQLRSRGGGPPYTKLGRAVFYEQNDLDHWIRRKKFRSTADYL